MFDFLDSKNIGKAYKDFYLVAVENLPDLNTKGIYLRHKKTGLEVYHIPADDNENLFAFTFRTVALNSKGAAHIMEHSALCGSEKFPLKEPFTTLENQSVKTYLNALTYPEKTCYPASSLVKSDYFNLMDVYADSVFFPLLSKETFMQEGHRLEMDENGKLSIQGVVYNEMKGNYSSFNSVARDSIFSSMFPGSYAAFESGGDPLKIPELTYEEFLDFHKKFYKPDNCLLFLYGNIPTSEQLDFIDEKYIGRILSAYDCKEPENLLSQKPLVSKEILSLSKLNKIEKPVEIRAIAPASGATGANVSLNWYAGKKTLDKILLTELLCGNEYTPLNVKLIESGLGDEVSPFSRLIYQYDESFFSCGLSGVKKGNEEKVKDLILKSLQEIYEEGFSDDLIAGITMAIDFDLRECSRGYGPYSLNLLSQVGRNWFSGSSMNLGLDTINELEALKKKLKQDSDYLRKLLKELFIDQNYATFTVVEPSKKFYQERNKQEKELIKKMKANTDLNILKKELDALHNYQQKIETPEELACIPHLKVSELTVPENDETIKLDYISLDNGNRLPLLTSTEDTKGIVYLELMYPFDVLPAEDYVHVPLLLEISDALGWAGKNWQQADTEAAKVMRFFSGDVVTFTGYDDSLSKTLEEDLKEKNLYHRDWFAINTCFLTEYCNEVFKVLTEAIGSMDFKDEKRLKEILTEDWNSLKTGFVSSGSRLIQRRIMINYDRTMAIREIQQGLTQLEAFKKYRSMKPKVILQKMEDMFRQISNAGGMIHITADEKSQKQLLPLIKNFAEDCHLKEPVKSGHYEINELLPYISQFDNKTINSESFKYASQTGFSAVAFPVEKGYSKESIALDVLASWMSNHTLWEKIRTTGGAYGANAAMDHGSGIFKLSSYRDPNPEVTIELYLKILKEVADFDFTYEDVEPCIISCYSDEINPLSKETKGTIDSRRYLNANPGLTPDFVKKLLSITEKDVKAAAVRLYEAALKTRNEAIFCDISKKFYGKNLELPL